MHINKLPASGEEEDLYPKCCYGHPGQDFLFAFDENDRHTVVFIRDFFLLQTLEISLVINTVIEFCKFILHFFFLFFFKSFCFS